MSVNAPESGTVKEFLVSEEDTVTVGQDLVKLELGGAPDVKKEEPKEPTGAENKQPSEPEQPKAPEAPKSSSPVPEQPPAPKSEPSKAQSQPTSNAQPSLGSREERRVCFLLLPSYGLSLIGFFSFFLFSRLK